MTERYQQQHHALGSEVFFTLVLGPGAEFAQQLFVELLSQTTAFEKQFSRFLPDSELTKFNQQSGVQTKITPSFHALLTAAKSMAKKTDGLYNPFTLPALQQAGYVGSWPKSDKPRPGTNFAKRQLVTIDRLEIGDDWAKIPANSALDFGGIGKGYLLDELAEFLDNKKLTGYWLSLGGDVICAGLDLGDKPWEVAIQNADKAEETTRKISNAEGQTLAIATSGVTKRQGIKDGQAWHHIIDPRTGQPADTNVRTATVSGATATAADVYAKCIVIDGGALAKKYKSAGLIEDFWLQM